MKSTKNASMSKISNKDYNTHPGIIASPVSGKPNFASSPVSLSLGASVVQKRLCYIMEFKFGGIRITTYPEITR